MEIERIEVEELEQFPNVEYDDKAKCCRSYKKVLWELDEEEKEAMLKLYNDSQKKETEAVYGSTTAGVLKVIAVILFVVGGIAGFVMAEESPAVMFAVWVVTFIQGSLIFALGKVVEILNEQKHLLKLIYKK